MSISLRWLFLIISFFAIWFAATFSQSRLAIELASLLTLLVFFASILVSVYHPEDRVRRFAFGFYIFAIGSILLTTFGAFNIGTTTGALSGWIVELAGDSTEEGNAGLTQYPTSRLFPNASVLRFAVAQSSRPIAATLAGVVGGVIAICISKPNGDLENLGL